MNKSVLVVRTAPDSPEGAEAYNDWYDNTHLAELLALEGCTSAQRYVAPDGGSYVAIYEFDCDANTAQARFGSAFPNMAPVVNVRMDPPPTLEFYDIYGG